MDKEKFVEILQSKFKMVRTESGFTQDKMAIVVGLSKKTLVQIEKERVLPNWTTCITVCALFRESEVLFNTFGGDPLEVANVLAKGHVTYYNNKQHELVWWETLETKDTVELQKNRRTNLFRVMAKDDHATVFASFKESDVRANFERLL